jgi:hypothetical protein
MKLAGNSRSRDVFQTAAATHGEADCKNQTSFRERKTGPDEEEMISNVAA